MPHHPRLLTVVAPLLVESILGLAIGVIGTLLASRVSDTAGAAFGLSNQIWGSLFILFRVVGAGVSVVVSQHLGARQRGAADAVSCACLGGATWMGAALGLICTCGAHWLLLAMSAPANVAALAQPYLQILGLVILLEALSTAASGVLRAHLFVNDVLKAIFTMHGVHVVLALLLAPKFGLIGYACAMVVSRIVVIAIYFYLWRTRLHLLPTARDFWALQRARLAPVIAIGLPTMIENFGWTFGFIVSVRVASQLGEAVLATHAYVIQIVFAVIIASISIGLGAEILIGRLIGAGEFARADTLARKSLKIGMVSAFTFALIAALLGNHLLGLFTNDPKIIASGMTLLWLGLLIEPGRAVNIIMNDTLRAAGDARYPALAGLPSQLFVLGAGSWWLGTHLGLGLVGVWLIYALDEWIRGTINWLRWQKKGWIPAAQKAHFSAQIG
jgi:putative MATE family efflux protein